MKALAVFVAACAVFATTPSSAFMHMMGPHPGGPPPHGGGGHHGQHGLGFLDGALGPAILPPLPDAAAPAPEPAVAALPPAPRCLTAEPVVIRATGPHIIYIGQKPAITGPKVIYGSQ